MLDAEVLLEERVEGIEVAQRKGALKVPFICSMQDISRDRSLKKISVAAQLPQQ